MLIIQMVLKVISTNIIDIREISDYNLQDKLYLT